MKTTNTKPTIASKVRNALRQSFKAYEDDGEAFAEVAVKVIAEVIVESPAWKGHKEIGGYAIKWRNAKLADKPKAATDLEAKIIDKVEIAVYQAKSETRPNETPTEPAQSSMLKAWLEDQLDAATETTLYDYDEFSHCQPDSDLWQPSDVEQIRFKLFGDINIPAQTANRYLDTLKRRSMPKSRREFTSRPEFRYRSRNLETDEPLTDTAFLDVRLEITPEGETIIRPHTLAHKYLSIIPHNLPMRYNGEPDNDLPPKPIWNAVMKWQCENALRLAGIHEDNPDNFNREYHNLLDMNYFQIGTALIDNRKQQLFIDYGKGGTSKGLKSKIIRHIVGESNAKSTTMKKLERNFTAFVFANQRFISITELGKPTPEGMEALRAMTGEDFIDAEGKNIRITPDIQINALVSLETNNLLCLALGAEGPSPLARRASIIPHGESIPYPTEEQTQIINKGDTEDIIALIGKCQIPRLHQIIIDNHEIPAITAEAIHVYTAYIAENRVPTCELSESLRKQITTTDLAEFADLFIRRIGNRIPNAQILEALNDFLDYPPEKPLTANSGKFKDAKNNLAATHNARYYRNGTERGLEHIAFNDAQ